MKLSNTALSLFPAWINVDSLPDGLKMLAAYAAKRPGLEFRDYCRGYGDVDGRAAYFREARSITQDLARVRDALRHACAANITDDLLIECSKGERLTLERDGAALRLDYCVGQYWPTEYRGAVARLLESAVRMQKVAA
jgi:hypothetical protein